MKHKGFGHLKTRLFTIETSKNVGYGGPWYIVFCLIDSVGQFLLITFFLKVNFLRAQHSTALGGKLVITDLEKTNPRPGKHIGIPFHIQETQQFDFLFQIIATSPHPKR